MIKIKNRKKGAEEEMAQDYNYTDEFKTQIAKLREAGKPISAIVKEYGLAKDGKQVAS